MPADWDVFVTDGVVTVTPHRAGPDSSCALPVTHRVARRALVVSTASGLRQAVREVRESARRLAAKMCFGETRQDFAGLQLILDFFLNCSRNLDRVYLHWWVPGMA